MADQTRAPVVAPYGTWRSPISAEAVAAGTVRLAQVVVSGPDVYWLEGRPEEGGRNAIVRHPLVGETADVTPAWFNARTRVHEYGGGAYAVHGSVVFATHDADQRLYRIDPGEEPRPITPEPPAPRALRYADMSLSPDGTLIVCVHERHEPDGTVVNELVALPADGSAPPRTIASGRDFYSSPRISPDGRRLLWTCWDQPNMPWDGCELWVADLAPDGTVGGARLVAGGLTESTFQPSWSPSGTLTFVSDRTGWWNLYQEEGGEVVPLAPMEAEFGLPQWVFAQSQYDFLPDGRIACVYIQEGIAHLGLIRPGAHRVEPIDLPFTSLGSLRAGEGNRLWFLAASPTEAPTVVSLDLATGDVRRVRRSAASPPSPGYVSLPRSIAFPTEDGQTAYAFFYPPANQDFVGPPGEKPPLIVVSHGGPTADTRPELDLEYLFFTSRGFGVVDVNYGGSTGYGRAYRERLNGRWGIVDVDDCVNAARYLVERGEADPQRLIIRGGSAGGYTTLCALTFRDVFTAGSSYFGVADAEALARDTHKFESRYLDRLIGPYPEAREVYRERSPIHFTDRLSCPVILLQGLEDPVVPPSQAEAMAAALEAKGIPYAYVPFPGEQHGFRKAESIRRALEAELYFFGRIFGFTPADRLEPIEIKGL